MRIASLVPSSTEMLFALGLGDDTVGVTHECDFPPAAAALPRLTATVMPEGLSAGEIDAAVKRMTAKRELLARAARQMAHDGIAFNASELPRSFRG